MIGFRASCAAVLGIGAVLAFACSTPLDTYYCDTNADCEGAGQVGAICEGSRLCSFADPSCGPEGHRYGSASGDESNQCVSGAEADAARSDAPPSVDAGLPVSTDAASACADSSEASIGLTVYDDYTANNKLKIRINGQTFMECQATPEPVPGTDTMVQCSFCIPIGTAIQISWYEGVDIITSFTTDCAPSCPIQNELSCDFTVTESCSATGIYDPAVPPP